MDYHSALIFINTLLFITPAASVILLVICFVLFLISFLMAGAQVAFFSLTFKDINLLKTKQQPSFKRIVLLLEQPKTLLASMVLANIFVNLGIILTANVLLDDWLNPLHILIWLAFLIKFVIIAFVMLLFCEILPKIWATHHKVWFASSASLIVEIINGVLFRFSKRMVRFGDRIEMKSSPYHSTSMDENQLDYAIDLLPEHEASIEEKQILKGIRKFGNTTVKQIMRTRLDVSGIDQSTEFNDMVRKIEELHYSRLPIYKNSLDEIVGILHTKDLLPYLNASTAETFNWLSLVREAYFVHEQKLIEDLLREFRKRHIHFAIVVDEFGGTSGIVTLEDVMEEIIGDIKDEFDDEESVNKKIDDYNYIFEGKTMINDVCKAMNLPNNTFEKVRGDSDSLAGLVLELAGKFPQIDEEVVCGNFKFIALEIAKNRLEKIKVIINNSAAE